MNSTKTNVRIRDFQLLIMGWVSVLIAPLSILIPMITYGYPFPGSISEVGTIGNQTAALLPFCLGGLALFAVSYSLYGAYDYKWDKIFPAIMSVGFSLVAMQPCSSDYLYVGKVGLFGLSHQLSDVVHYTGALMGFAALMGWILLCFRKGSSNPTKEKIIRNRVYLGLTIAMFSTLALAPLSLVFHYPATMAVEAGVLTFAGAACLIKGGLLLKDKGV